MPFHKATAVEPFYNYLLRQRDANISPFWHGGTTGANYVLKHIKESLEHFRNVAKESSSEPDPLDF
jgi:hypothetical protein